jgi:hypothetical protein
MMHFRYFTAVFLNNTHPRLGKKRMIIFGDILMRVLYSGTGPSALYSGTSPSVLYSGKSLYKITCSTSVIIIFEKTLASISVYLNRNSKQTCAQISQV